MAILVTNLVAKAIPAKKNPSNITVKLPSFDTMTKAKQHYCTRFGGLEIFTSSCEESSNK